MYRIALCDIPDTTLRCSTLLDIANDEKMVFVHVVVFALVIFLPEMLSTLDISCS